jgi:hypothetical protein
MGVTTQKYGVSGGFRKNRRLTRMDFGQNFDFLKINKNSYTGPLCITYLHYVHYDQEIQSFGLFFPQTGDFR